MRQAFFGSGADGLVANYARGFVGSDIEFVRDLPLRRLDILHRGITDLTPVHDLGSTLGEFRVQAAPGSHIDLTLLGLHGRGPVQVPDRVPAQPGDHRGLSEGQG
jgi:hypothetical protein